MKQLILKLTFFCTIVALMTSCVQYEELVYFRKIEEDKPRSQLEADTIQNLTALTIQRNDVLSITVNTFDPELSVPFNLVMGQMAANAGQGGSVSPFISYIVDENGQIDYPVLGKLDVLGLTITEAENLIIEKLQTYLKDPVVNMRLFSFRISVLGEVERPGTFIINNDRITVLEALGMAGDLTSYANRTNILVVREQDGIRNFKELDLQSSEIFKSEFYYLKQGDVVYVEPTKAKEATVRDQLGEVIPWVSAAVGAVTTTINLIIISRR